MAELIFFPEIIINHSLEKKIKQHHRHIYKGNISTEFLHR